MFFMRKIFLGLGFVFLISLGGLGTQSSSLIMQGIGFIGLLVGLVVLYVFGRMVWKGLGCLPSFLILSAIVLFIMYALGMFNNGLAGVGDSFLKFLGYRQEVAAEAEEADQEEPDIGQDQVVNAQFSEDFPPIENEEQQTATEVQEENSAETFVSPDLFVEQKQAPAEPSQPKKNNSSIGMLESMAKSLAGSSRPQQQVKPFNPNDYPVVYGAVRVINGDTLEMYGKYFRLYGIDAPESNQTCADRQGRAYSCGREAAVWLKSWIQDNELECHVIQQDTKGNMIGTCSFGPYDLGAALVNAGWAVANVRQTDIYSAYEMQAQKDRRGLWQGSFYKPWDWRKLQSRKPKIKVMRQKERKKGIFG